MADARPSGAGTEQREGRRMTSRSFNLTGRGAGRETGSEQGRAARGGGPPGPGRAEGRRARKIARCLSHSTALAFIRNDSDRPEVLVTFC